MTHEFTPKQKMTLISLLIVSVVLVSLLSYSYVLEIQSTTTTFIDQSGVWAPLLYILVYAVIGLSGFSVTVLSMIAIGLFEPLVAFWVILAGATLTASGAFLIARYSPLEISSWSSGKSSKVSLQSMVTRIERSASTHSFGTIFLLRLARLPYIGLSYGAGFVRTVSLKSFVLATLISNALSAIVFVIIGVAALQYMAVAAVLVLILLIMYWFISQRKRAN